MQTDSKKSGLISFLKRNYKGYLIISPVMLGILFFTLLPMLSSLYYSFFDYDVVSSPINFGLQNYIRPFKEDWAVFSHSWMITIILTVVTVPLGLILSFLLALLLNNKMPAVGFFRVLYYIPVIIPGIVMALIWNDIFEYTFGIANTILNNLKLPSYGWFFMEETALKSFILLSFFGIGGNMVLWLAQLKGVPEVLYEAANLEGANTFQKILNIDIPLCTPMIFYLLIIGIIGTLQVFSQAFLLQSSGNSLNFVVVNIYNLGFGRHKMGYASALSWMLFIIIGLLTIVVFKTSKWVFYGENM